MNQLHDEMRTVLTRIGESNPLSGQKTLLASNQEFWLQSLTTIQMNTESHALVTNYPTANEHTEYFTGVVENI